MATFRHQSIVQMPRDFKKVATTDQEGPFITLYDISSNVMAYVHLAPGEELVRVKTDEEENAEPA